MWAVGQQRSADLRGGMLPFSTTRKSIQQSGSTENEQSSRPTPQKQDKHHLASFNGIPARVGEKNPTDLLISTFFNLG